VYNPTGLTITTYRANSDDLIRSGSPITIQGTLKDVYGNGLVNAYVKLAVYKGAQLVNTNDYFTVGGSLPIVVTATGTFSLTLQAKATANLGDLTVYFYFEGNFANDTGTPTLNYWNLSLRQNATAVSVKIVDQPTITSSFVYSGSPVYPGETTTTISGILRYSNSTGIGSQSITIRIYDSFNTEIDSQTTSTIANGNFAFTPIVVQGTFHHYIVYFNGNPSVYILSTATGSILFTEG
jgi:hypothetical protein